MGHYEKTWVVKPIHWEHATADMFVNGPPELEILVVVGYSAVLSWLVFVACPRPSEETGQKRFSGSSSNSEGRQVIYLLFMIYENNWVYWQHKN